MDKCFSAYISVHQIQTKLNDEDNSRLFFVIFCAAILGCVFDGSTLTFADYGIIRKTVDEGTSVGDQRRLGNLVTF